MTQHGLGTANTANNFFGNKVLQIDPQLDFNSKILLKAHTTWLSAGGDVGFPKKETLVPFGFSKDILAHILLQEIEHQPRLRCRWRLIGTHITNILGRDSTGKYWDEIYSPAVLARQFESTNWILENRAPLRYVVTSPIENQYFLTSENLDLPVSSDGTNIDMIIIIADFSGSNPKPR
jgi:hypothetical protein